MKRITFLFGSGPGFSGQRFASELLVAGLRQRGWQVQIINTPLLDRTEQSNGMKLVAARLKLVLGLLVAWGKGLWKACGVDVMCVSLGQTRWALVRDGFPLLVKASFTAQDCPVVISLNGNLFMSWGYHSIEAKLLRRIVKVARHITVVGPTQKAQLIKLGLPAQKVIHMDNSCLLPHISEKECLNKQTVSAQTPLDILYLSSLIETKGYVEFVEAIGQLGSNARFPIRATLCGTITLMHAGERFGTHENARDWIKERIAEINQSQWAQLRWINGAVGQLKETLFREAQIFVLPSRYRVEAQPIAILEALASGCAVITTKIGEIPTTLNDQTALLLGEATPEAIATAIWELLRNPDKRRDLALNGLKLFKERFDYEKHLDHWEKLLLAMVAEREGHQ